MFASLVKRTFLCTSADAGVEASPRRVAAGRAGAGRSGSLLRMLATALPVAVAATPSAPCSFGAGGDCLEASSDTASLLQFSLPQALKVPDATTPVSAALLGMTELAGSKMPTAATELMQQVRSIAKSVAEGNEHLDPNAVTIIDNLIALLNDTTTSAINTGLSEDQSEVNGLAAAADSCSIAALNDTTVTNQRSDLQVCLGTQTTLSATKTAADGALNSFLTNLAPPTAFPDSRTVASIRAYFTSLTSYVNTNSGELEGLVAAADAASAALTAQKATCATTQGVFENSVCALGVASTTGCTTYQSCYDAAGAAYNAALPAVQETESARKAQYKALKKAFCYLEIVKSGEQSTVLQQKLTACDGLTISTTFLDVNYPGVPTAKTCTPLATLPCTEAFLDAEYKGYTEWSSWLNTACTAC
jgi:hypothetical protein